MSTLTRAKDLQARTKQFAVRIVKAFARLPKDEAVRVIGRQLVRSGTSATEIVRYDHGDVVLGEFAAPNEKRARVIAAEFARGGIRCTITANLLADRWRKLVWNVPFNSLSILAGGIDTAAILADDALREMTIGLMREVVATANACGHSLSESDVDEQLQRTSTMGAYKPSTLLDWETGRALEVESIWGERSVVARAPGRRCRGSSSFTLCCARFAQDRQPGEG